MSRRPTYLPSRRDENRGSREAGFPIGSADFGPRTALDLHGRWRGLRHRFPLDHRQARVGIKSVYRK